MENIEQKRKRGTGRIFNKKGTSLLYIRYYGPDANGNRVQKEEATGTDDPIKAEAILRDRLVTVARGGNAPADVLQLRYEDIRDPYLEDNPQVREDKAKLARLDDFFGDMKLIRLKTPVIRNYIKSRSEGDEGVAGPTIRRELTILRAMFNHARETGSLGSVDIPYFPMPEDSKARKGFLEADQFEKLKKALPDSIRPAVIFMYFTGCRKGAVKKIEWDMVNQDCTEIELPGEITKSGDPLTLPLTGALEELSTVLKELAAPQTVTEHGKVYTFKKRAGHVFNFVNFRVAWNKACHKAGLGKYENRLYEGLMPHDLRRSAVRNLIRAGVSESVAMEISGHKTASVFKRYNITDTKDLHDAMGKVKDYTEGVIQKSKRA